VKSQGITWATLCVDDDWSAEETDDPLYADRRNFYKVEKWSLEFGNASATNVIARF
jgi:hypothetical protein